MCFQRPHENVLSVVFLENECLLRIDSESKVVLEEISNAETNVTSLDENSVHENIEVHTEYVAVGFDD